MKLILSSLVIIFAGEIKAAYSPGPELPNHSISNQLSKHFSLQNPSIPNSNPCDAAGINGGSTGAHLACQNECLSLKPEIVDSYRTHPDFKTSKFLYSRCGLATAGRCSYSPKEDVLIMDLDISGETVPVLVDTGSPITIMHQRYTQSYMPMKKDPNIRRINNEKLDILGISTIFVDIQGVKTAVTGLVAGQHVNLVLGTDFFVSYSAKINLRKLKMELSISSNSVIADIKWQNAPAEHAMIQRDVGNFIALHISAKFNGYDTRIIIDTCGTIDIVNKDMVKRGKIHRAHNQLETGGTVTTFTGTTNLDIVIEGVKFKSQAFVTPYETSKTLVVGSPFCKQNVEVIDYAEEVVSLNPGRNKRTIATRAYIRK